MKEFDSLFYKRNKLIIITLIIYVVLFVFCLIVVLGRIQVLVHFPVYMICSFIFLLAMLFMILRACYFIFEKVLVDMEKGVVSLRILRKQFVISQIRSIKRVRAGQIRIISKNGKVFPLSLENEEEFIRCVKAVYSNISLE